MNAEGEFSEAELEHLERYGSPPPPKTKAEGGKPRDERGRFTHIEKVKAARAKKAKAA